MDRYRYLVNPHRLHPGIIGLKPENDVRPTNVENIKQSPDMWNGIINSRFTNYFSCLYMTWQR